MLGWIFALAQIGALLALLLWWRQFPLAMLLLAVSAAQSVSSIAADAYSVRWWQSVWMPVEVVHLVAAALAVAESFLRLTVPLEALERFWMRFGVLMLSACMGRILWTNGDSAYGAFLNFRVAAWGSLAFMLTMTLVYFLFRPFKTAPRVLPHALLLGCWMACHAVVAGLPVVDADTWMNRRAIYRTVTILLCVLWTRLAFARSGQPDPSALQPLA